MIFGLTLPEALFAVFLCWILYVGVLWWREVVRNRHFDWRLSDPRIFFCDRCRHTFHINEPADLTRCPRCNAVCFRRRDPNH